nr:hypothetical protein [Sphaerisporangium album]
MPAVMSGMTKPSPVLASVSSSPAFLAGSVVFSVTVCVGFGVALREVDADGEEDVEGDALLLGDALVEGHPEALVLGDELALGLVLVDGVAEASASAKAANRTTISPAARAAPGVCEELAEGDALDDAEALGEVEVEGLPEELGVVELDGLELLELVGDEVGHADWLGVGEPVPDPEGVGEAEVLGDPLAHGLADALGDALAEALALGLPETQGDGDPLPDGEGLPVPLPVGVEPAESATPGFGAGVLAWSKVTVSVSGVSGSVPSTSASRRADSSVAVAGTAAHVTVCSWTPAASWSMVRRASSVSGIGLVAVPDGCGVAGAAACVPGAAVGVAVGVAGGAATSACSADSVPLITTTGSAMTTVLCARVTVTVPPYLTVPPPVAGS